MNGRKIATVDNEGKIRPLLDGKHIGYLGPADGRVSADGIARLKALAVDE